MLAKVASKKRDIESVGIGDPSMNVGDRDDPSASLIEQTGRSLADVAEALDSDTGAVELEPAAASRVRDRVDDALAGRVRAADRTADGDRLAGHDARHRIAPMHRDRVHDPGHRLGVRAHVGCRDVRVGADDPLELGSEATGQGFELLRTHRARIAGHAAFGAAERDVDEGCLPGHPHRQRPDVIEIGLRVESQAALGRPARDVVLDPVALEDLDRAVITLDGEMHRELPLRDPEDGAQAGFERDVVGRGIELASAAAKASAPADVGARAVTTCIK